MCHEQRCPKHKELGDRVYTNIKRFCNYSKRDKYMTKKKNYTDASSFPRFARWSSSGDDVSNA